MAAAAAVITLTLIPKKPRTITCPPKTKPTHFRSLSSPPIVTSATPLDRDTTRESAVSSGVAGLVGAAGFGLGLAVTAVVQPSSAAAASVPLLMGQQLSEPANALSLPTWAVHVSSVVEWITAMALVWQYGEKSGFESWKGLSWGMVPLLGGAFCACTWHFFYNSESLEILVALQAALTVIGNATMCIAAFRIFKSSEERRKNL